MQDIPRRDFLGGAAGLMAALATGGCAPMADPSTKPSAQSMPKFAYVGSYTTKERNGQGEGINVYQVDPGTGNWTHVQLLKDIVNPSFLALEPGERFLYSAHGDGDEALGIHGHPFRRRGSGVRDPRPVFGDRAAVHAQIEAGDHLRVVGGQEDGGFGVVARAREPAGRHHLLEVEHPAAPAVGSRTAPRRRALERLFAIGRGRGEAVHADPVLGQVHGRGAREVQQAALARAVRDVAGLPLVAGRGHDHDDAAPAPLLDIYEDRDANTEAQEYQDGSAKIALGLPSPFDNYLRIASPEMFPEAEMLPHLICSRPIFIGGANDEADQHGGA